MNLLIPTIMLISCLYIVWYMMREKKQTVELTEEQIFNIEEKLHRDLKSCAPFWRENGHFNTAHYVKYLEYNEMNKA